MSDPRAYLAEVRQRGGRLWSSTELQSLAEAEATVSGFTTFVCPPLVRHLAHVYTLRRREAEAERTKKRERRQGRWQRIASGEISPFSIVSKRAAA